MVVHSKNDYVAANVVRNVVLRYIYATSSTTLDTTLAFSNVVHYVRHPKWNYFVSNVSHVVFVNRNYMLKCCLKKKKKNLHPARDSNSIPQRYLFPCCASLSTAPHGILKLIELKLLLKSLLY